MAPVVLSFFDYTAMAVLDWARAGYETHIFDLLHEDHTIVQEGSGTVHLRHADLSGNSPDWAAIVDEFKDRNVAFVFGFPPCTDLAASGARHWAKKREADACFQDKAVAMAKRVAWAADKLNAPYMVENPNGALSTLWRKPNYSFHPYEYGGYLLDNDVHPRWPEYIPPRDAYPKTTRLWTGNGFIMPDKCPVEPVLVELVRKDGTVTRSSPQWAKLGGKSLKTKNIRNATPRGFAKAVFFANAFPEEIKEAA